MRSSRPPKTVRRRNYQQRAFSLRGVSKKNWPDWRWFADISGVIHPTAIVSPLATLGRNVRVGPYCVVGANVELGDDCVLHSHVVLDGHSKFGRANEFFAFAAIGGKTQDLKYVGDPTYLEVGDH